MQLSIIILNYKTPFLTSQCVDSVIKHLDGSITYEVLIADNCSDDGSYEYLSSKYSEYKNILVVSNAENLGFSRGNNELAKLAKGKYLLFLNSDTLILEKEAIVGLINKMENDNTIGLSACKLLNEDRTLQISYAKLPRFIDIVSEYLFGKLTNHYKKQFNDVAEVESVIGAFMIIKKSLFMDIGMFDEDYYFNAEDIDLCARVRRAGYRIIYDPRHAIIHFGGGSQGGVAWVNNKNLHENRIKYCYKHYKFPISTLAKLSILLGISLRKVFQKVKA